MSNTVVTRIVSAMYSKKAAEVSDIIFRGLFSLIFIVGGLGHFLRSEEMLVRIRESPWHETVLLFGDPLVHLWLSGFALVIGGIALALGWYARLAALVLLITLIPITMAIHVAPGHVGPFLKNVAIAGGLIHFMFRGPGRFAIDPH